MHMFGTPCGYVCNVTTEGESQCFLCVFIVWGVQSAKKQCEQRNTERRAKPDHASAFMQLRWVYFTNDRPDHI